MQLKEISPASWKPLSRGFSLIELLAAIGIVAALMALLLPFMSSMKGKARDAQAAGNLRQLFTAQMQYAADNGGNIAPVYQNGVSRPWQTTLGPYLYPNLGGTNDNETQIFRISRQTVFDVPGIDRGTLAAPKRSIGVNWCLSPYGDSGAKYRIAAWPRPAGTILMGEMVEGNNDVVNAPDVASPTSFPRFRRKGDRALMLFGDGHVQALSREELAYNGKTADENLWKWW